MLELDHKQSGEHHVANALAVAAVGLECGLSINGVAAALSNVYAGTSQPAELKLHAVYSVRAGGAISPRP